MDSQFASMLISEVQAFDEREAPHGLYGVQPVYAAGRHLPSLAYILGLPATAVLTNLGKLYRHRRGADGIVIGVDDEVVSLTVLDYASTKIRRFGSAYRLDKHDGKQAPSRPLQLEKRVPDLAKPGYDAGGKALLLIAHVMRETEIGPLTGRVTQRDFLDRYTLDFQSSMWRDRYGRNFFTALLLWYTPSH